MSAVSGMSYLVRNVLAMKIPDRSSSPLAGCHVAYDAAFVRPAPSSGTAIPQRRVGFIYVLSNPAMPGMVKIGFTYDLAEDRAKRLYDTGVPLPFKVEFEALTSFPAEVEAAAHASLDNYRVSAGREFFQVSPFLAVETVKNTLLDVASIYRWNFEEPQRVREGDRIALSMEQGDLLIPLAFPHLVSDSSEPVDLWMSHADGDLLELMGVDPEYAAGLSDYDDVAEDDPVPFLDRAEQRPNGEMNGRERLVPGDRLLWLRPMLDGKFCVLAIFEMHTYCQVISRTWDPQFDESGTPMLLQDWRVEGAPPGVVLAVRAVMRMPMPRTWAPRNPDPDDGWVRTGVSQAPPEYWLTQYAKKRRSGRRRKPGAS